MPGAAPTPQRLNLSIASNETPASQQKQRAPEHKLVRTDSRSQTLYAFMSPLGQPKKAESSQSSLNTEPLSSIIDIDLPDSSSQESLTEVFEVDTTMNPQPISQQKESQKDDEDLVDVQLTSVIELREDIEFKEHEGLTELFREHCFVGCVDSKLATIQHRTRLLLIDFHKIRCDLFPSLMLPKTNIPLISQKK